MKNRITTPRGVDLLYQASLLMACALLVGCQSPAPMEARLPGPFTQLDRVEIGGEGGIALVRDGEIWRMEGTPFLVDEWAAASLERAFHVRWEPSELRPIEHTGEALRVVGDRALEVRIVPTGGQPVSYVQGRTEEQDDGTAVWILPRNSAEAALIPSGLSLTPDPLQWRSDEVLNVDPAAVRALVLTPGPTARRSEGDWVGEGDELDPYRVEQLVRLLAGMDAGPIPTEAAPSSSSARFELTTESDTHVIAVHQTPDGPRLSVSGTVAFELSASDAAALELAHRTLGESERLALVPERISRLSLSEAGRRHAFTQTDQGWAHDGELAIPDGLDRWVRAVTRLDAFYDAPESRLAFIIPRRTVDLHLAERSVRVDFVWRDDEDVYARIDGGLPFRTERSAERILRTPLLTEHSETNP